MDRWTEISETCVMQHMRAAARRVTRVYERALAPVDLTATQFSTLVALARQDGQPLSALAARLDLDRTTMNRVLGPLRDRDLVRLGTADGDRRVRTVHLGPAAPGTMAEAARLWSAAQARVLADLAPEDDWPALRDRLDRLGQP